MADYASFSDLYKIKKEVHDVTERIKRIESQIESLERDTSKIKPVIEGDRLQNRPPIVVKLDEVEKFIGQMEDAIKQRLLRVEIALGIITILIVVLIWQSF